MRVTELKKVLEGTGATVKTVRHEAAQDPYVLYSRKYQLKTKSFVHVSEIKEFFGGKKIVACDCDDHDSTPLYFIVKYWIHESGIVKKEIAR